MRKEEVKQQLGRRRKAGGAAISRWLGLGRHHPWVGPARNANRRMCLVLTACQAAWCWQRSKGGAGPAAKAHQRIPAEGTRKLFDLVGTLEDDEKSRLYADKEPPV